MKGATDNAGRHSASGQSGPRLLHTFCYRPPVNDDHNQLAKKSQAWSALFSEPMSDLDRRYMASVDFDNGPVPATWEPVSSGETWQVARFPVGAGVHFILADQPLSIIVYGYDQYVSYGYPGGLNLDVMVEGQQ